MKLSIFNPARKHDAGTGYTLTEQELKEVKNEITFQMLRRVQIFCTIAFLIHLFIVIFVVPGNMKIYTGQTLWAYRLLLFADISVIAGSLFFFVPAVALYPKSPQEITGVHRFIVIGCCFYLLLWAAVKTGFQQAFVGQISIYLVILLTVGAGALIGTKSSFFIFGIPYAVFVAGSLYFNKSPALLQDNLINGSSLTLVSWFLTRLLYKNHYSNLVKQRIIEKQNNDLQKERNLLQQNYSLLEAELSLARKIQDLLIPHASPMPGVASLYKPMHKVGGDFFDYITFRETNELGIFLSDVSGHGVPAAFITAMIKSFILQARNDLRNPAGLIRNLNDHLFLHTNRNFITAFYGILNFDTKTFRFANAGHCHPIIIDSDGPRYIDIPQNGFPLAIMSLEEIRSINRDFTNNEVVLDGVKKLVLYTDGLTEADGGSYPGPDFETRLIHPDMAGIRELPAPVFIEKVYRNLVDFHGGELFEDDICMICVDL